MSHDSILNKSNEAEKILKEGYSSTFFLRKEKN